MARYESDFTLFMKEMNKNSPTCMKTTRRPRPPVDKPQDTSLQRQFDAAKIKDDAH